MARDWKKTVAICGSIAVAALAVTYVVRRRMKEDAEDAGSTSDGLDLVDLYIDESFPASDAPGYAPTTSIGGQR